jgi:hypothetical protein
VVLGIFREKRKRSESLTVFKKLAGKTPIEKSRFLKPIIPSPKN